MIRVVIVDDQPLVRGGFAALIAASRTYVGYDSAGGHLAAAVGTPGVDVFQGAPCERMIERWSPSGPGQVEIVVPAESDSPEEVLRAVAERLP